jgi:hypothetical protein
MLLCHDVNSSHSEVQNTVTSLSKEHYIQTLHDIWKKEGNIKKLMHKNYLNIHKKNRKVS